MVNQIGPQKYHWKPKGIAHWLTYRHWLPGSTRPALTCSKSTTFTYVVLVFLLLTMNRFHRMFWCFRYWLWKIKCPQGMYQNENTLHWSYITLTPPEQLTQGKWQIPFLFWLDFLDANGLVESLQMIRRYCMYFSLIIYWQIVDTFESLGQTFDQRRHNEWNNPSTGQGYSNIHLGIYSGFSM